MGKVKVVNGKVMYEVGDVVTIVSKDELLRTETVVGVNSEMLEYCGQKCRIAGAIERSYGYIYDLEDNPWTWENAFFEEGNFALAKDTGGALTSEGLSDFISTFVLKA